MYQSQHSRRFEIEKKRGKIGFYGPITIFFRKNRGLSCNSKKYSYLCTAEPLERASAEAQMAESVDALVSNTSRFTPVPVRPRLWVQKTLVEQLLRGFLLFKTSKMVTFGHHFENGGQKNASKAVQKKCRKIRFLREDLKKSNYTIKLKIVQDWRNNKACYLLATDFISK